MRAKPRPILFHPRKVDFSRRGVGYSRRQFVHPGRPYRPYYPLEGELPTSALKERMLWNRLNGGDF